MQYYLFTVTKVSWREHLSTGIAAINDPAHDPSNRQGNAQRQVALCELAGIKKGDFIFFYLQGEKHLIGAFKACSSPFFDNRKLVRGGFIDRKFPIRIAFKQVVNFTLPLNMDEVWKIKDEGFFWSIQQQRGDAVGRHACVCLTRQDGEFIIRMLYEKNPVLQSIRNTRIKKFLNKPLPFDLSNIGGKLKYEATLQGLLLDDFKKGKHKEIFGDYNYFIPFFPTSSQKEIDILLIKYNGKGVLWYEILELKKDKFTKDELDKVINYEDWLINTLGNNNLRKVHSVGIAHSFNDEAKDYIKGRIKYGGKKIRLIKYTYNNRYKKLVLDEVE